MQLGAWCEGVTTFHVGVLAGYSLFPKPLTTRLRKSRRDRFDEEQRASVNAAERDLAAFEGLNKAAGPAAAAAAAAAAAPLATEKAEEKAELTERLAQLKALAAAFQDPGPVYDCLVFNDGTLWRAVVDVGCAGDLTAAPVMANFREAQQYVEGRGVRIMLLSTFGVHTHGVPHTRCIHTVYTPPWPHTHLCATGIHVIPTPYIHRIQPFKHPIYPPLLNALHTPHYTHSCIYPYSRSYTPVYTPVLHTPLYTLVGTTTSGRRRCSTSV